MRQLKCFRKELRRIWCMYIYYRQNELLGHIHFINQRSTNTFISSHCIFYNKSTLLRCNLHIIKCTHLKYSPMCFDKCMYSPPPQSRHRTFPSPQKLLSALLHLSTFGIVRIFNFSHCIRDGVLFHCGSNLHFTDNDTEYFF